MARRRKAKRRDSAGRWRDNKGRFTSPPRRAKKPPKYIEPETPEELEAAGIDLTPREQGEAFGRLLRRERKRKIPPLEPERRKRYLGRVKTRGETEPMRKILEKSKPFQKILGAKKGQKVAVTVRGRAGKKKRELRATTRTFEVNRTKKQTGRRLLYNMIRTLAAAEGKRGSTARQRRGTDEWLLAVEELEWDFSLVSEEVAEELAEEE